MTSGNVTVSANDTTGVPWICRRCRQEMRTGYWLNMDGPYCFFCWNVLLSPLDAGAKKCCCSCHEEHPVTTPSYPGTTTIRSDIGPNY